jgi:hypothetical protein
MTPATVKTPTEDMAEPFSRQRNAEHPVRWSPADGDTPAYLTLKGAGERLAKTNGGDPKEYEGLLLEGRLLRSMFAFYAIDEAMA